VFDLIYASKLGTEQDASAKIEYYVEARDAYVPSNASIANWNPDTDMRPLAATTISSI